VTLSQQIDCRIVLQFCKLVTNVNGGHRHRFQVIHSDNFYLNKTKLNHEVLGDFPSAVMYRSRFGE